MSLPFFHSVPGVLKIHTYLELRTLSTFCKVNNLLNHVMDKLWKPKKNLCKDRSEEERATISKVILFWKDYKTVECDGCGEVFGVMNRHTKEVTCIGAPNCKLSCKNTVCDSPETTEQLLPVDTDPDNMPATPSTQSPTISPIPDDTEVNVDTEIEKPVTPKLHCLESIEEMLQKFRKRPIESFYTSTRPFPTLEVPESTKRSTPSPQLDITIESPPPDLPISPADAEQADEQEVINSDTLSPETPQNNGTQKPDIPKNKEVCKSTEPFFEFEDFSRFRIAPKPEEFPKMSPLVWAKTLALTLNQEPSRNPAPVQFKTSIQVPPAPSFTGFRFPCRPNLGRMAVRLTVAQQELAELQETITHHRPKIIKRPQGRGRFPS